MNLPVALSPPPRPSIWVALSADRQHRAIRLVAQMAVKFAAAPAPSVSPEPSHVPRDLHPAAR